MPFSLHDPVTAQLLYRVFDAAMLDLAGTPALSAARKSTTIAQITKQLLAAADTGEREPERLKLLALEGINRSASN
ncbi:MAG TPA: hypothetical protein VHI72_13740 [Hyphomicrobiaceae bacterium]|jgi:hypothetical protein|nr:hypothetical protein [Hyphomicrobiaceae bacterium]